MTPWQWRHVWPITDPYARRADLIAAAQADLDAVLADRCILAAGPVQWQITDDHDRRECDADLVLVAVVPAVPARPAGDQWPALLAWAAERGWSDQRLASVLGLPKTTVTKRRQRAGLPGLPARRAA